ncbi:hypothetical protein FHS85_003721 [Rhodoligotrophos appendicifer]|uniref:hypothetical protein n=1 Tax=Rhodoligotrophos appendicifer TaxID=987056 RepID=UPI0011849907|nr:hypothetical protein [Rhodoligotrophos appendicifer]
MVQSSRHSCHRGPKSLGGAIIFALALLAPSAQAQETAPAAASAATIDIELNRLEQRPEACRLSFVYRNRLGTVLDALQLETVLFDREEKVERFLVLSSKALPEDKIRVQQFDINGLKCADLGMILVNDVKVCDGEGLDASGCLGRLALTSKTEAKLVSSVDQ